MASGDRLIDTEFTDPQAMRALAHPVRLAILDRLQGHVPATCGDRKAVAAGQAV
ncbi:hypothetical protein [Streptomyces hirsutus]